MPFLQNYKANEDPKKFQSKKTGRGPLEGNWAVNTFTDTDIAHFSIASNDICFWFSQKTTEPVMCAYKLVTVEFKWFGLQNRVESFIQKVH